MTLLLWLIVAAFVIAGIVVIARGYRTVNGVRSTNSGLILGIVLIALGVVIGIVLGVIPTR